MNLRLLANTVIQTVNPDISINWIRSTGGYTTDATGPRTPTTNTTTVMGNVQGLNAKDLAHTDGLNIQGVLRSVHLYGNVQGVVRADQQGGDVLQFSEVPGGPLRNWRVVLVSESWPDWCRVIVWLQ